MNKEDQLTQAKFLIDRYDKYLQVVDIKGNFLMAYHFFIVGGILLNYDNLNALFNNEGIYWNWNVFKLVATLTIINSLASVYFILRAVYPFLKSKTSSKSKNSEIKSLIYFGDVSTKKSETYIEELKNQSKKNNLKDVQEQAHALSVALTQKFKNIKTAGRLCYFHFVLAVLSIIYKLL